MVRTLAGLALFAFFPSVIFCQSANKPPAFTIADIHPSVPTPNAQPRNVKGPFIAGDRFELRSATVLDVMRLAYSPANAFMYDADKIVGGPSWLDFSRYDIAARVPPNSSYENIKMMLRTLLADRFKLVIRTDSTPLPAYALTTGQKPALKEAANGGEMGCKRSGDFPAPGATVLYTCRHVTMAAFVEDMRSIGGGILSDHRIVDQTGIKGAWDFDLKFAPIRLPGTDALTFIEAVQKQLGLEMVLTKVPTPVLVVADAKEKPTPNPPGVSQALPPLPQEFEVATVKPTAPDYQGFRFQVEPGGRVEFHGSPLRTIIARAWGLTTSSELLVGPKFMDTARFDIVAKAPTFGLPPAPPAATASDPLLAVRLSFTDNDSVYPMLRALLIERFGLTFHTEDRPLPAFKLTATKPRLQKADPSHRTGCHMQSGPPPTVFACENITMAQFTEALPTYDIAAVLSRRDGPLTDVVDASALQGAWDFTVRFNPLSSVGGGANQGANPFRAAPRGDPAAGGGSDLGKADDPVGATFFEALEKQLGLKLERIRRVGKVMVIDHLDEKPKAR
jgi:uncharacterized protein (TIGR03435 family)